MDVTSYLLGKKSGGGSKPPVLQDKEVIITENGTTNITADTGYDGLSEVEVITNVSGSTTPTIGFAVNVWSNDGFPIEITTYGFVTLPIYFFYVTNSNQVWKELKNVIFNSEMTKIGDYSFSGCTSLELTTLSNNINELGKKCFNNCIGLKKLSMPNVRTIASNISNNSAFDSCTGLKKVWIGSNIDHLQHYAFKGCSNLEAIYIDLPRATVESFPGYSYAFMNDTSKVGIIVCNDDEDFIDKGTFDRLVVS